MAYTTIGTNNDLVPKIKLAHSKQLFLDIESDSYLFSRFKGNGVGQRDSIITYFSDLEKEAGDRITVGLRSKLKSAGVQGNATLKGNEEALNFESFSFNLDYQRFGVTIKELMTKQRVQADLGLEAREGLTARWAEWVDGKIIESLVTDPTQVVWNNNGNIAVSTDYSTVLSSLGASTSKFTPDLIRATKMSAVTGFGGSRYKMRPVMDKGKAMFVCLISPQQALDLRLDPQYEQFVREAEVRGKDNPLFTGSLAVIDNVIIHEHDQITTGDNAGASANVDYSTAHFLGAQAVAVAFGYLQPMEEERDDYGAQKGFAICRALGIEKVKFDNKDYASIAIPTSITQLKLS